MIGLKNVLTCGTLRVLFVLKLQVEQMTGDYWAGMNESVNLATDSHKQVDYRQEVKIEDIVQQLGCKGA